MNNNIEKDIHLEIHNEHFVLTENQMKEAIKTYCSLKDIPRAVNANNKWLSAKSFNSFLAENNIIPEKAII